MDNRFKKIASHTVAVVIGLMFASCVREDQPKIITNEVIKEVRVEVPVEKIVEKEVVVYKTKIKKIYVPNDAYLINIHKHYTVIDKKHRLSFFGGLAPSKLRVKATSNGHEVSMANDPVVGLGYAYNLDTKFSIGFNILSNQSYLMSVGRDF